MSKSKKDKFLSLVGGQTDDVGSDQKLKVLDSIIGDSRDSDSAKDADNDDGNRHDAPGSNDKTASEVSAETNVVTGEEIEDSGAGSAETRESTAGTADLLDRTDAGGSGSTHKLLRATVTEPGDSEKTDDANSENVNMIAKNIVDDSNESNSIDNITNKSGVRFSDDDVSTNISETGSENNVADKNITVSNGGVQDATRSQDDGGTISGDAFNSDIENSDDDDSGANDDTHAVSGIGDDVVSALINNAVAIIRGQNEGSVNPATAEAIYGPLMHRKKYTERHERVTWYIEKELLAEVKILNKMGVNKSQILNDALRLYLRVLAGSNQGTPKTTPNQTAKRGGKKNR